MDTLTHKKGQPRPAASPDFVVVDDLAGQPVSEAELDVIEAFLMAQFRAVMAGERPATASLSVTADSNLPQSRAGIATTVKRRRARR